MRVAFMHRRLRGGGTEGDLRRMAEGLVARGHSVHVFCACRDAGPPGVTVHPVPIVPAGRVARLLSFAVLAPRAVARERWDVVVGFGRTLRQDVVRVGGDERLAAWRRTAEERPLAGRVAVTGPRDDVPALLAAADVACVPSRQEAFGNVVLEACAAGVPVVTSRRAGAAELLDGPLATLVVDDPADLGGLAAGIGRALGQEAPALRPLARRAAERQPWSRHLDEVEALLEDVARGG